MHASLCEMNMLYMMQPHPCPGYVLIPSPAVVVDSRASLHVLAEIKYIYIIINFKYIFVCIFKFCGGSLLMFLRFYRLYSTLWFYRLHLLTFLPHGYRKPTVRSRICLAARRNALRLLCESIVSHLSGLLLQKVVYIFICIGLPPLA
jgi:hypothetical protein